MPFWLTLAVFAFFGLNYVALWYYAWITARNALNVPLVALPPPIQGPRSGEPVEFLARDGSRVHGHWIPADHETGRVILFCHQTGADGRSWERFARRLPSAGFHLLCVDFRQLPAMGRPIGSPTQYQWPAQSEAWDVLGAVDYVKTRLPQARLGALGISKGAVVAMAAATRTPAIEAVIVDSLFSTIETLTIYMRRWARLYVKPPQVVRWVPDWLYRWVAQMALPLASRMARTSFLTVEPSLRRLRQPSFFIYNAADAFVEAPAMKRLLAIVQAPKELWVIPEAGHAEASEKDPTAYQHRLIAFFNRHLPPASPVQHA